MPRALFLIVLLLMARSGWAQRVPIAWERFAGGFRAPVQVTAAGDGTGRLFVVEQGGRVRILRDGAAAAEPFLDISSRVMAEAETGLFSIAFPPGFAQKQYLYALFVNKESAVTLARYRVSGNPDVADAATEEVLLEIPNDLGQHYGGTIAFSPVDGMLYMSVGDGGIGVGEDGKYTDDPQKNGQNAGTLLGKMLRIDTENGEKPYGVPAGNPRKEGWLPEVWSVGWRNPWRFSFDRATGDLYVGDVGAEAIEEIDFEPAGEGGRNYGWSLREGTRCLPGRECADVDGLTPPAFEYEHDDGCSVTGGVVYRGERFPALAGTYFFSDFCNGMVWGMRRDGERWEVEKLGPAPAMTVSFGRDEAGEVYLVDYRGSILRLAQAQPGFAIRSAGNAASGEPGMVAGGRVSIVTSGLPGLAAPVEAESTPLPARLGPVTVWVNGTQAALLAATPEGRVDIVAPYVLPGETARVQVRSGFDISDPVEVAVRVVQPGLVVAEGRTALAVNEEGAVTTAGVRGTTIALFGTGLGPVTNPPEYGYPAAAEPPAAVRGTVTATVGGAAAEVVFASLSPGFSGLYTVLVKIPENIAPGWSDIVVAVDGVEAPAVQLEIR